MEENMKWKRWDEDEIKLLKELYPHSSWIILLKNIKRSKQNIKAKGWISVDVDED